MYKLYYSPFSCSFAVHIALIKTGATFELMKIDVRQGMHQKDDYLKLNKRGNVPLLDDGVQLIDQGASILFYLAEKYPESGMMPAINDARRAAALSTLFYMSNTVHPTIKMAIYPERYSNGNSNEVVSSALERTKSLLAEFEQTLTNTPFLDGTTAFCGDYYLATALNWLQLFKVSLAPYPNLKAYKRRMNELPEVSQATLKEMEEF